MFLSFLQCSDFIVTKKSLILILIIALSFCLFLNSELSLVINIVITLFSPIFTSFFFKDKWISSNKLLMVFFIYGLLFCLDGFWRLSHPYTVNIDKLESLGIGFQIYKVNSFMYLDSNFVGLQAILFLSAFLYFFRNVRLYKFSWFLYTIILGLLILGTALTFSRAAVISMVMLFILYFLMGKRNSLIIFLFIAPVLFSFAGFYTYEKFNSDISFSSKFHIISATINYISNASLSNILFGLGVGNAVDAIGMGAHNILITYLLETGLLGMFLFLSILLYLCCSLKDDMLIVVFPFLITAMSLGTTAIPYFLTFACLAVLYKKQRFCII